jgi:hypothetical protein
MPLIALKLQGMTVPGRLSLLLYLNLRLAVHKSLLNLRLLAVHKSLLHLLVFVLKICSIIGRLLEIAPRQFKPSSFIFFRGIRGLSLEKGAAKDKDLLIYTAVRSKMMKLKTWTHTFVCLAHVAHRSIPDANEHTSLKLAGLGEKRFRYLLMEQAWNCRNKGIPEVG